jgi:tetratricopeptide (TPR) repeat protein
VILPSRPRRCVARRLTAAGIFLLGLAGCTTLQLQALVGSRSAGIPQRAELEAVPFFPQEDYQCGPAALAMVLGAGGKAIEPEALRPQVYLPDRHGSLQIEMIAAARRNGFVAIELAPNLSDLLAEIAAGNPVIVLQNLALDWYPAWHYAVAIGYDLRAQRIALRSGTERRLQMPLDTFEHTWRRSGYWAMLALPPRRLPASVAVGDYLNAVARLEKIGRAAAAREAYESALERWPDDLTALIGLGNTAHRDGDLEAAEQAFRRAILVHPRSAAAHNNLAQTLEELDRHDEALAEAREAVGLGGPLEDVSMRTLDAIVTHTGRGEQEWNR